MKADPIRALDIALRTGAGLALALAGLAMLAQITARYVFDAPFTWAEEFATLMTLEMGKVFAESMGEVKYGGEFFRWFAEEAVRIGGDYAVAPNGAGRFLVTRQPVGPALLITPWNFPMAMGPRKIGPAVAAGCTRWQAAPSLPTRAEKGSVRG